MTKKISVRSSDRAKEFRIKFVRDWAGVIFGLIGTTLAVVGFLRATKANELAVANEARTRRIQIEQNLTEAWDLFGGKVGTAIIFEIVDNPAQLELARRKINEAITLDPNYAKAHRYKAIYQEAIADNDGAIVSYQRAITLEPKSAATYVNLGITLSGQNKIKDALDAYEKARNYGGKEAIVLLNLVALYHQAGQEAKAEQALAQAKDLLASTRGVFTSEQLERIGNLQSVADWIKEKLAPRVYIRAGLEK